MQGNKFEMGEREKKWLHEETYQAYCISNKTDTFCFSGMIITFVFKFYLCLKETLPCS